jgi:steroid 5-alpha reductase family enzyme
MIKTIIILILTFIIVPVATYYLDDPLTAQQTLILWNCIYVCIGVATYCFVLSQVTGNCSQVDKLWSIIPIYYVWYIALAGGMNERLVIMAVLVTLWGIRLTYNFSRRGAYTWKFWTGEEDYRWEVLRQKPELKGKVRWFFFNLFFISFYQQGLLLLITLPSLVALKGAATPLGFLDYLAAGLFLFFLVIETIADQQQWNYQQEKHKRIKSGEKLTGIYALGFTHTGLWSKMRHPNYMAEQAIWICLYLFSVAATGAWLNWSIAGCLLLMVLFQGSSDFSESISAEKYPEYKVYQEKAGRFLPGY